MKPVRYIAVCPERGVLLGHAMGLSFWTRLDPVGQDSATTFDSPADATNVLREVFDEDPKALSFVQVEGDMRNPDGSYFASREACVDAGCDPWFLDTAFDTSPQRESRALSLDRTYAVVLDDHASYIVDGSTGLVLSWKPLHDRVDALAVPYRKIAQFDLKRYLDVVTSLYGDWDPHPIRLETIGYQTAEDERQAASEWQHHEAWMEPAPPPEGDYAFMAAELHPRHTVQ